MSLTNWILATFVTAAIVAAAAIVVEIRGAYGRLTNASEVLTTPDGEVEFTRGGSGPPVLVVHGSGGGFDQGALVARAILDDGVQWIAPSRFGYLRSTFREGATFDDQARAYAHLLDRLGIEKVAVVALSHGGPSALLFAVMYPERVSSLTLLSCGVASSSGGDQAQANQKGDRLTTIFKYDLLYWAASTLLRRQLMELMGASEVVIAGLTPEQRDLVDAVIDEMNPVRPRYAGVTFDHRAAMPNERIAAITAPTLIIHARDDGLQLYRNAEFAAATIPGAHLRTFDRGGHLVIAVEQATIRAEVQAFIREHLPH
ncbi:MAG: alpha/beta hydrolase [Acidobacteria bacterium]|nr:alpha/beta hydrolase [Acidobacteriota bacterium]